MLGLRAFLGLLLHQFLVICPDPVSNFLEQCVRALDDRLYLFLRGAVIGPIEPGRAFLAVLLKRADLREIIAV